MGYEVDNIEKIECKCGNGKIKRITKSNEWNQFKESIIIECKSCSEKYEIISENCCPKPKHEYTINYLKDKTTGEKIKINI